MGKGIYTGVGGTARKVRHIYTGVDGVARKVKRVYVGDSNGKARLCWSAGEVAKYGTLDAVGEVILSAGQNKNYAVVLGTNNAYSYDKSLTKTQQGSITNYSFYGTTPGSVGEYAVFAGGYYNSNSYLSQDHILAYNGAMTKTALTLPTATDSMGAASVGNYLIFAGGISTVYDEEEDDYDSTVLSSAYAYNASLTRTTVSSLSKARYQLEGGSIGGYALFAGGNTYSLGQGGETAIVDAYNASLTRTTASALSYARYIIAAANVGDYLIFAGGYLYGSGGSTANASIDCYNKSLTKISINTLSTARSHVAGGSLGDYALFAGGQKYYNSTLYDTVDMYDESLTRTTGTALYAARRSIRPAKVGDYLLFLGGSGSSSSTKYNTDVYMVD